MTNTDLVPLAGRGSELLLVLGAPTSRLYEVRGRWAETQIRPQARIDAFAWPGGTPFTAHGGSADTVHTCITVYGRDMDALGRSMRYDVGVVCSRTTGRRGRRLVHAGAGASRAPACTHRPRP